MPPDRKNVEGPVSCIHENSTIPILEPLFILRFSCHETRCTQHAMEAHVYPFCSRRSMVDSSRTRRVSGMYTYVISVHLAGGLV